LRRYGPRIAIIAAASAFLILLGAAVRGGMGFVQTATRAAALPVQRVLGSSAKWFNRMYGYLYQYDSLMAENESLRTQLAEAQQSARDGVAASEENVRLRKAQELAEKHRDYVLESAKVVLWSDSVWASSFTISKGRSSGIELGDPVITEYGALVGQVTEIDDTSAVVSTVIDVDMSVGAYVGSSGSAGMVVGEYALMKYKTAKLTFLADGAQIFEGDEVLTSGSGGAFPPGLIIGTISNVQTEAGGQIEYGIVVPQVEMDSLVQVFIIKEFARGD
jgi:rod shape-determining protein MreC